MLLVELSFGICVHFWRRYCCKTFILTPQIIFKTSVQINNLSLECLSNCDNEWLVEARGSGRHLLMNLAIIVQLQIRNAYVGLQTKYF